MPAISKSLVRHNLDLWDHNADVRPIHKLEHAVQQDDSTGKAKKAQ
jgi:hypothetical protein